MRDRVGHQSGTIAWKCPVHTLLNEKGGRPNFYFRPWCWCLVFCPERGFVGRPRLQTGRIKCPPRIIMFGRCGIWNGGKFWSSDSKVTELSINLVLNRLQFRFRESLLCMLGGYHDVMVCRRVIIPREVCLFSSFCWLCKNIDELINGVFDPWFSLDRLISQRCT